MRVCIHVSPQIDTHVNIRWQEQPLYKALLMVDRLTVEVNAIALHVSHLKTPWKQLIKFPTALPLDRPQLSSYVCSMKSSTGELSRKQNQTKPKTKKQRQRKLSLLSVASTVRADSRTWMLPMEKFWLRLSLQFVLMKKNLSDQFNNCNSELWKPQTNTSLKTNNYKGLLTVLLEELRMTVDLSME